MKKVSELLRLDGRAAIVTGGAGHIGLAFAQTLAELGADVVVVDLHEDACRGRASEIEAYGGGAALGIAADLASPEAAQQIVDATLARFGRIDVVVNNAAFTGASGLPGYAVPFAEQTYEAWDAALKVNLSAPFALTHAARDALAASGHGSVINVSSIYGVVGPNMGLYEGTKMGNPAAYGASKGGLVQLTRYLATVMAPAVRVNAISPGGIERGQPEAFQRRYEKLTPLARMGHEEDLKGALAFLASDVSQYVTGQNIVVDGGWTAW
jgi:NAD(P)-dependent dehydrogenase (short-subunit alcohol dehydrogenase family)